MKLIELIIKKRVSWPKPCSLIWTSQFDGFSLVKYTDSQQSNPDYLILFYLRDRLIL